jgi:uncharacterized membrane protein
MRLAPWFFFPLRPTRFLGAALLLLGTTAFFLPVQGQSARFDEFAEASPKAGEMAPDFTLLTLGNESFNLMSVAADMPVVVEFGSFT